MTTRAARAALPWLLMLSGFCGISYEILYNRLLGNLLGNQFFVSATVLLTFLLGIGCGTLYAHRFARLLWLVEAGIGAYAALMVTAQPWIERLFYTWVPGLGGSVHAVVLVAFLLLAVPSFLIGCSVPLFAAYLSTIRATGVFSVTYGIYNLGAAATALVLEFVLLRLLGLRATTLCVAGLNGVVALGVLALMCLAPLVPARRRDHIRYPARVLAALAVASVASAVFQLLLIKLAEFIFGPYSETFALVLATVLCGLALGSLAAGRFGLGFDGAMLLCLAGLACTVGGLPLALALYAALHPWAATSYPLLVSLKLALTIVLMGLPATGFGATIPALLRTHKNIARESGQLLFCSSVANALGFLLMAFVLHRHLDYGPILMLVALAAALALLIHSAGRRWRAAVAAIALALACYAGFWNETLLYLGHTSFHSTAALNEARATRVFADRFKGPRDVFAILWKDDIPYFFINGYISIPMAGENASERLFGAVSAMLAPRADSALVLGMGSGATAGTVGLVFDRTDVVEINGVVLENLHRMSDYNFDVERISGLRIIHDDGIRFVRNSRERYSLLVNTVTSPLYFSSSKLYTRDFFEMVRERLTPDGVYITWADSRVGDRGLDIILGTLAETFTSCWLIYLDADYFILGCSNEALGLRLLEQVTQEERLREYLAHAHALPVRLLPYTIVSTHALELRSPDPAPVNTLDLPALEFEMAQLSVERPLLEFLRRLHETMDLRRVRADVGASTDWSPAEFLFLRDLRLSDESTLGRTLTAMVPWQFPQVVRDFEVTVAALAEEVDSATAFYRYGTILYRRGHHEAALGLLQEASARNPARREAHYWAGRALLALGEPARAESEFLQEWELTRGGLAALGVGAALVETARYAEALEWLGRAEADLPRAQRSEVLLYEGLAHEGLGDTAEALGCWRRSLAEDPADERVLAAMRRLAATLPAGAVPDLGKPGVPESLP